jgi:hypothetical protein
MADYFTHFSEVIPQLKPEEEAWLREQLQCVQLIDGQECRLENIPPHLAGREPDWRGCRLLRDIEDAEDYHDYGPGFDYEFADDGDPDGWGRHLWLHGDEGTRLLAVVHLVQKFLRGFRAQDCWSLPYACVCSHPRVGEFGGGGIVVTADEDFWLDAHSWVVDQQVLLRRKAEQEISGIRQAPVIRLSIDPKAVSRHSSAALGADNSDNDFEPVFDFRDAIAEGEIQITAAQHEALERLACGGFVIQIDPAGKLRFS